MIATVIKGYRGGYTVRLKQGVQYFTLDYAGTKKEAEWLAKMFRLALSKAKQEWLQKKKKSK